MRLLKHLIAEIKVAVSKLFNEHIRISEEIIESPYEEHHIIKKEISALLEKSG